MTSAKMADLFQRESAKWAAVIREGGIQAD
jgi:hypothetical protein